MKKKILYTLLGLLCLYSCKAPQYIIGMNEQEFVRHNKVIAVQQTEHVSIYKKVNYPFAAPAEIKFFYFRDSKLIRVDNGRQPDVIIDKTIHSN